MMVKILTLEYTANKKYTIYTLRKMGIISSMPNERSQTQKAKLIFSDSCRTNNSPEMGMLAEVD